MEWDPAKRLSNPRKHGLDFRDLAEFDFSIALIELDDRSSPSEERELAIGFVKGRLCAVIYTERHNVLRIISLRIATRREAARCPDFRLRNVGSSQRVRRPTRTASVMRRMRV